MPFAAPVSWVLNTTPTAAQLTQELITNPTSLRTMNDLAVKVFRTSNQSIASSLTNTAVSWQSSAWNVGAMWVLATNPTRITAPVSGIYHLGVNIPWTNNGTGRRSAGWRPNGGGVTYDLQHQESTGVDTCNGSEYIKLTAGDYIEVMVHQDSGIALNVLGGTEQNATASLRLVATGSAEPPIWEPPRVWADGNPAGFVSRAQMNTYVFDAVTNLRYLKGAGCSVYLQDVDVSVSADQRQPIPWDALNWGVGSMWTNGSQIRAPVTGIYQVSINLEFGDPSNVSGVLGCGYVLNDSATHHDVMFEEMNGASGKNTSGVDLVRMIAGDEIAIYPYQDSGESLSLKNGIDRTRASLVLLAATS